MGSLTSLLPRSGPLIDLRKPVRASPGRGRRVGLVLGLLALTLVAVTASLAIGTKAITPDAVWAALWHPAGTEDDIVVNALRLPRTVLGLVVGIALGVGRRADAGPHPQPAGRPRAAGRHRGRGVPRGDRHLRVAAHQPVQLRLVRLRRRARGRRRGRSSLGVGRPRTDPPRSPGARGRRGQRPARRVDVRGGARSTRSTLDAYPVLGGRLAGRARRRGRRRRWCRSCCAGLVLALAQRLRPERCCRSATTSRRRSGRTSAGHALGRHRRDHPAHRRGHRRLRADRVRRAGRAARRAAVFTGPDYRWLVPASGLAGAVLLLAADVVGRIVARPGELEVGHRAERWSAAPFFVALVRRRRLVALMTLAPENGSRGRPPPALPRRLGRVARPDRCW